MIQNRTCQIMSVIQKRFGRLRAVFKNKAVFVAFWGIYLLTISNDVLAQCEKWKDFELKGQNDRFCAPVTQDLGIKYSVEAGSAVEFYVNWGNTKETTSTPTPTDTFFIQGKPYVWYEDTVSHTYQKEGDQCNYKIEIYVVINGSLCLNSKKTTEVSVWDKDNANGGKPLINPVLYRVCYGESANVIFDDESIWNCVPASGETDAPNKENRWNQWVYGTSPSTISGVVVGNSITTYPYTGTVEYLPAYVINPSSQSLNVAVPGTTTASDVGKVFTVKLRNWNICNPYDANLLDGNPLNPANPNGDSAYIETEARIMIVDKAAPAFQTRRSSSTGSVATTFCTGEKVYFQDLTVSMADADFAFDWKMYDDQAGTVLLKSDAIQNPTYRFANKGRKRIDLTVRDLNSVGQCSGTITRYIDIVSVAEAAIQVTDENDLPLPGLCYDPINNPSFTIKLKDVSTGFEPLNSNWQWDFYHFNGSMYQQDSSKNGSVYQESFVATFQQPGSYMTVLTNTVQGVNCFTQDTAYVHIYRQPVAAFEVPAVCQDNNTLLTSTATIPIVVDNDFIQTYEWDFDYDGTNFTVDATQNSNSPFSYAFLQAGTYQVAHRVTTARGGCSDVVVKNVDVKPTPFVTFKADELSGCSPLTVTFSVDTLLANQPSPISTYLWHVKDLKTGTENIMSTNPTADFWTAPAFVNTQSSLIDHVYEVWLEGESVNGCSAVSDKVAVTVYPGPASEFVITNLQGGDNNCAPRNYRFQVAAATQSLSPATYQWTILDEADSSLIADISLGGNNPDFDYTLDNNSQNAKKYRIRLQASRSGLCFTATEKLVTVNPVPSSGFTATLISTDCQQVKYLVEAQQKGLAYQWVLNPLPLNNPDLSRDQFEVVYDKKTGVTSSVAIRLKTSNIANCVSAETVQNISIDPKETVDASFVVNPGILEIPQKTVTITSQTTSAAWTYLWDFGDGTTSTLSAPGTHEYATPGTYWIKVLVSGQYCFDKDSAQVIVKQTLPVIDFTFSTIEGCLPLTVEFFNQTKFADTATYLWDFGDGDFSREIDPSHQYTTSGIYTVTLEASNSLGTTVKKETDLVIDLSQGPKADFNIRLAKAYLPDQNIVFSNQSQRADIFHWNFGDGTISNEKDAVHAYEASGDYTITLIVQNALGCSDTLSKPIFIEPLVPEVDFSYAPPTGCRPLTVRFRNLSRYAEPGSYRWSFGQGQGVSTEENPSYTYYEPGVYTVTLEASNSIGVTAIERKEFSVEVYENPIAAFNLRPDKAFLGEDIYLVNLSVHGATYFWDFGDGLTSTDREPVHRYEQPGTYDITLIAKNEHGCVDTLKKVGVVLIEKGGKIQVPNAFTPNTSGPVGSDGSGAGKNDVFLPVLEGVTSFHMMIYNRWGELLFESREKNYGWSGYYKGQLCPKDVYVYKLELKFSDGRSDTMVGDVTLIR